VIVEELVPDPRRPGSTRVIVDGRPAWTVPADVVAALGLAPARPLPAGAAAALDAAADEEAAFRAAIKAIEQRAHGTVELTRKLGRRSHGEEAVAGAVARLTRLGLLDDAAFARSYVEARARRGSGPIRIRHDLARLGVPKEVIAAALAALQTDDEAPDPMERTLAQAERRVASMQGLTRDAKRRRLLAFFARRGWSGSVANGHVRRLVGEG
jgi:regulatory protein